MQHEEMVALLRGGVPQPGGIWADLGAGTGNFTWALAELIGADGTIYAVDRDGRAISAQQERIRAGRPPATIVPQQADVLQLGSKAARLPLLDGVLMANLLHFIRDQTGLLQQLIPQIRPGGRLLIVEYEQALPIPWVPFPVPFQRFVTLAEAAKLRSPTQTGIRRSPSSGQQMYAAVATTSLCCVNIITQQFLWVALLPPNRSHSGQVAAPIDLADQDSTQQRHSSVRLLHARYNHSPHQSAPVRLAARGDDHSPPRLAD